MTECDGCGKAIGHAVSIEGEYHSDKLERQNYYFGDSECKRLFEEEHEVVEKVKCEDCDKILEKSESVKGTKQVSGIECRVRRCPDCADSFSKQNEGEEVEQ